MSNAEDQQFCLRWNNFQANITSQFETLRDDEDFVDVTLACEGQRLEAHKVVLSACSPFFKELFKSNPCPHPIIFMRDVEARHIIALLEFMYAGEVNVSQAHLSGFLRTAESLQIRGLTDASKAHKIQPKSTDGQEQSMCNVQQSQSNRSLVNKSNLCTTSTKSLSPQPNIKSLKSEHSTTKQHLNVSSIETTVTDEKSQKSNKNPSPSSSPTPAKRQCKETITENILSENNRLDDKTESEDVPQKSSGNMNINPFATLHQTQFRDVHSELDLEADIVEPKVELPDYASDEEMRAESRMTESILGLDGPDTDQLSNIRGGMDILSGSSSLNIAEMSQESLQGIQDASSIHVTKKESSVVLTDSPNYNVFSYDNDQQTSNHLTLDNNLQIVSVSAILVDPEGQITLPQNMMITPVVATKADNSRNETVISGDISSIPENECPYCRKNISSKSNMRKHIYRMHKNNSTVDCCHCGKITKDKYALKDHIRRFH